MYQGLVQILRIPSHFNFYNTPMRHYYTYEVLLLFILYIKKLRHKEGAQSHSASKL